MQLQLSILILLLINLLLLKNRSEMLYCYFDGHLAVTKEVYCFFLITGVELRCW